MSTMKVFILEDDPDRINYFIRIHSHNDVGAENMKTILTTGGFTTVDTILFDFLARQWERGTLNFLGERK